MQVHARSMIGHRRAAAIVAVDSTASSASIAYASDRPIPRRITLTLFNSFSAALASQNMSKKKAPAKGRMKAKSAQLPTRDKGDVHQPAAAVEADGETAAVEETTAEEQAPSVGDGSP